MWLYLNFGYEYIDVLNVNPRHKKAIILLLYQNDIKVLKDALAHLGPYQTLISFWYIGPGSENTVPFARHYTNLKNSHTNTFCMVIPHSEQ